MQRRALLAGVGKTILGLSSLGLLESFTERAAGAVDWTRDSKPEKHKSLSIQVVPVKSLVLEDPWTELLTATVYVPKNWSGARSGQIAGHLLLPGKSQVPSLVDAPEACFTVVAGDWQYSLHCVRIERHLEEPDQIGVCYKADYYCFRTSGAELIPVLTYVFLNTSLQKRWNA